MFSIFLFPLIPPPPTSTLFPYTTLFRSQWDARSGFQPQPPAPAPGHGQILWPPSNRPVQDNRGSACRFYRPQPRARRSEEHTSELQSRENLVCRLLLEKKKS